MSTTELRNQIKLLKQITDKKDTQVLCDFMLELLQMFETKQIGFNK